MKKEGRTKKGRPIFNCGPEVFLEKENLPNIVPPKMKLDLSETLAHHSHILLNDIQHFLCFLYYFLPHFIINLGARKYGFLVLLSPSLFFIF